MPLGKCTWLHLFAFADSEWSQNEGFRDYGWHVFAVDRGGKFTMIAGEVDNGMLPAWDEPPKSSHNTVYSVLEMRDQYKGKLRV